MSADLDGQIGMSIDTPMDVVRAVYALTHRAWSAAAIARILADDVSDDEKSAAMGISPLVDDMAERLQEVETKVRALHGLPRHGLQEPMPDVVPITASKAKRKAVRS